MADQNNITPTNQLTNWAIVLAPVLLILSSIAFWIDGDVNVSEFGGMLQVFAFGLLAIAFVVLTRPLEPKAPKSAAILLVFGIGISAIGLRHGVDSIWAAVANQAPLIDQVIDDRTLTAGEVALAPGALFAVVLIGLGVMYDRISLSPRWVAVLIIVAGVLFPVGRALDIGPAVLATDVLLLVAFGKIGLDALAEGR